MVTDRLSRHDTRHLLGGLERPPMAGVSLLPASFPSRGGRLRIRRGRPVGRRRLERVARVSVPALFQPSEPPQRGDHEFPYSGKHSGPIFGRDTCRGLLFAHPVSIDHFEALVYRQHWRLTSLARYTWTLTACVRRDDPSQVNWETALENDWLITLRDERRQRVVVTGFP